MNYGSRLFQLRDRQGLTNVEMANLLNISDSLYSRYEKEKQTIPINHLNTLCEYFKVSLDYIFGFTNTKKYNSSKKNINRNLSGKRLREIRNENNLTQIKLAQFLNTDNSTISKYEKALFPIATPYLYTICKKYNISADYLLGKTNKPKFVHE